MEIYIDYISPTKTRISNLPKQTLLKANFQAKSSYITIGWHIKQALARKLI